MAVNNTSMKKIWATKLTEFSIVDKEGIGAIRFEGAKIYKYVKYNSGIGAVAAVAGNVCVYHGDNALSLTEAEVTSDHSDGAGIVAGALQSAIPNGSFGWVQIKGLATLTTALGGGVDGYALIVGADGTLTVASAVTQFIAATAVDASARIVLLNCSF